jgi:pimeloyl-ACP methyl ester carboxylesterase
MGGLVAMMVAAKGDAAACIGLAPSTPTLKLDATVDVRDGEFGAEEYGITSDDPADQRAMPDLDMEERNVALASLGRESRYARDERKAGIVIESLPCPLLIVTGGNDRQWPIAHYDGLWLDADMHEVADASHWGLVLSRRALATMLPVVTDWVMEHTQSVS